MTTWTGYHAKLEARTCAASRVRGCVPRLTCGGSLTLWGTVIAFIGPISRAALTSRSPDGEESSLCMDAFGISMAIVLVQ